jgi:hypothetical protein
MDYNYNRYYGSFIRNEYDYPNDDYEYDPDALNFGINYSGNVAAIWVGSNPSQYAYCELSGDTSLSFSHSVGQLTNFSVNSANISLTSTTISLNSPLVNCQYEIRAPLGTFTSLSAPYKLFDIPHPSKPNKRLRHACLEGPEIAVYIRGRLFDSSIIEVPDYWEDLVDFSTINVSLTQIETSQDLVVESTYPDIRIKSNNGEVINCFYTVTATRKDVSPLEIEVDE